MTKPFEPRSDIFSFRWVEKRPVGKVRFAPLLLTFANLPQADVGGCAASQWHPVGEIAHQTFAMAKPLI